MAKVLYHQEAGDIEMDAQADTYTDPTNPEAGSEPSVSLFRNGKKTVTRAVEGDKIGQYSLVDPAIALKAEAAAAAAQVDLAEVEHLASENAALKAEVEAAKETAAQARADAGRLVSDAAAKAKAASEASAEAERLAAENAALKAELDAAKAAKAEAEAAAAAGRKGK